MQLIFACKKHLTSSTKQRRIFYILIPHGVIAFVALARTSLHRSLFDTYAEVWFLIYGSSAKEKIVFGFLKGGHA